MTTMMIRLRGRADDSQAVPPATLPTVPSRVRATHALTLLGAAVFLAVEIRGRWFYNDEWNFLAFRHVGLGTSGLFYPYYGHWTTIPILIWRLIFSVVGVRDYWLYAIPLVLAHLAVVHLLWRLMLTNRVEPWTATMLAMSFAVLGVGSYDMTFAFQVTFVGSVMFGLLAIDSMQRDRYVLPAVWGICALMCSDIGVPMVAACGLVGLARRKPKLAAYATLPPAAAFVLWYLAVGHAGSTASLSSSNVGHLGSFVWTGLTAALSGYLDASVYVGALLVVVIAISTMKSRSTATALAASVVVLYVFIGVGRINFGPGIAASDRYSYVAIALLLLPIGQVITTLMSKSDLRPFVIGGFVLLVGVNVVLLHAGDIRMHDAIVESGSQTQMDAAAYLIHNGEALPGQYLIDNASQLPLITKAITPTAKTMRAWVRDDKFPVPTHLARKDLQGEEAVLGTSVSATRRYGASLSLRRATDGDCSRVEPKAPAVLRLRHSGSLRITVPRREGTVIHISFSPTRGQAHAAVGIPITPHDRWLNVHASAYTTAIVSTPKPVLLCEASGA